MLQSSSKIPVWSGELSRPRKQNPIGKTDLQLRQAWCKRLLPLEPAAEILDGSGSGGGMSIRQAKEKVWLRACGFWIN